MSAQVNGQASSVWRRWFRRPQDLWIRKALFQAHLWTGLGIGLYVLAISISGSALVYRRELTKEFARKTAIVGERGQRMNADELTQRAQRVYPGYEVDYVREGETPDEPDDVVLERGHKRIERLFDPYTGADLGDPDSVVTGALEWLADLHDNLLGGRTGRLANGAGACLVTVLALSGAILWWPGIKNWRRSTTVKWTARFPRLNWDIHSAIGFWCWLFVLAWGISGIYFCFPAFSFNPQIRLAGGAFLSLLTQLHFGRFNWFTEALWTLMGLVPAASAVTGALMWWNRVLRKKFRRPYRRAERAASSEAPEMARATPGAE